MRVKKIEDALNAFPELRIGQLIVNVLPPDKDLFYISDEELMKAIENYVGGYEPLVRRRNGTLG